MSGRRIFNLARRDFLACGVASAADLALRRWGRCGPGQPFPNSPFEGVYVDRYTYRQGEPITVHASLTTPGLVDFQLVRYDTQVIVLVDTFTVFVPHHGEPDEPGVYGAGFEPVISIDTSGIEPGSYGLLMPPGVMETQNRENSYNGFSSDNTYVRFVVTSPVPGSHSRILWLHDSLLGVCYGSFGGQSIYGPDSVKRRTVSLRRPGCTGGTDNLQTLRLIREEGHALEYIDFAALDAEPLGYLDAYDVVFLVANGEYVTHGLMAHLQRYLDLGGSMLLAANEFASFRVRLDHEAGQLTTYKYDHVAEDPLHGTGSPTVAGLGMNIPETIWETEIAGMTLWASNRATAGVWVDFPVYNFDRAGWILEGTGVGPGGALPGAFKNYVSGNRVAFGGDGEPSIVDPLSTRTYGDTVVWAAFPSRDGHQWWQAVGGEHYQYWPPLVDGCVIATLQNLNAGGRVIGLPSPHVCDQHLDDPIYRTMMLNIIDGLIDPRTG